MPANTYVDRFVTSTQHSSGCGTRVDALSKLLIDDAIAIANAYDKRPDAAPRDLRAASLALAEEVARLRLLVATSAKAD